MGVFCNGQACSICGLATPQCLLHTIQLPALGVITVECYFADCEVSAMTNWQKRFMLYWWWAVNVFNVMGKGVRQELPWCIVQRIRATYPAPAGVAYTGLKPP